MSEHTGPGPERTAAGDLARDLTQRFADLVQRMGALVAPGGTGPAAVAAQWRAVLESGAEVTSAPLRQMQSMAELIRIHRDQVRSMQQQLSLYEEQLTTMDDAIRPLLQWGEQWQQAQQAMLGYLGQRADPGP